MPDSNSTASLPPLTRSLLFIMAIATGIAVASNYYAQPLLDTISNEFKLSHSSAGDIVTTAQVSYGLGVFFLIPLADKFERKALIVSMMLMATIGLLISGLSVNLTWLLIGTALTGFCTVVAQILVPFAATLAIPEQRGQAIGTVMGGLLIGILSARIFAGVLSSAFEWRAVYWVAFVAMLFATAALALRLPRYASQIKLGYIQTYKSVIRLFLDTPVLRYRSMLGLLSFALFSMFWTPLAFLLSSAPYHFNDATIGLFGLAGIVGIMAAPLTGKLADAGRSHQGTLAGLLLLLISWILLYTATFSLAGLIIGVLLLDMAVHLVHISNQSVIFALHPEQRNRINACYMTCYFIGGAGGSALSVSLYEHYGWHGVVAGSCVIALIGLLWKKTN